MIVAFTRSDDSAEKHDIPGKNNWTRHVLLVIHRLPSSHQQGNLLITPRCKGRELIECWIVREADRKARLIGS